MTAEYASDILDRVTNITYRTAGGGLVRSFAYRYDASSLITQQVVTADGACVTNAYAYDGLGRLVAESRIQESEVSSESYTYDLAGNRLSVSSVVNNTYTHNRLTAVSDGTSLAYDAAGNVTSIVSASSARKLTWNAQRQLVSVSTNGAFAESYAYDALGRRVRTTDSGGTVYHVYNGDECVADTDANGNPLRTYAWGPGIDDLLAVTVYGADATNTYYAVKDHLGSVHALVDAQGQTVESYTYDAWGNVQSAVGSGQSAVGNRYLFQGREYSYATGLYFFRARLYEPRVGRWLSNDPIGISGGLNLYAFCGDDPVNNRDPMGFCKEGETTTRDYVYQLHRDKWKILFWAVTIQFDKGYEWSTQEGRDLVTSDNIYKWRGRKLTGPQQGNVNAAYAFTYEYRTPLAGALVSGLGELIDALGGVSSARDAIGSFSANALGGWEASKDIAREMAIEQTVNFTTGIFFP